jgi:hypothetical protein
MDKQIVTPRNGNSDILLMSATPSIIYNTPGIGGFNRMHSVYVPIERNNLSVLEKLQSPILDPSTSNPNIIDNASGSAASSVFNRAPELTVGCGLNLSVETLIAKRVKNAYYGERMTEVHYPVGVLPDQSNVFEAGKNVAKRRSPQKANEEETVNKKSRHSF